MFVCVGVSRGLRSGAGEGSDSKFVSLPSEGEDEDSASDSGDDSSSEYDDQPGED